MTKMKTALLAAAAIGALSLGYSSQANATAYSLTHDAITQLTFQATNPNVNGGAAIPFNSFQFSADTNAFLASTGEFASDGDGHVGSAFSVDRGINPQNVVDPNASNTGTATNANNDFSANGQNNASYARADHILSDTAVNVAPGGSTIGGDFESITEAFVSVDNGFSNAGNSQTWNLRFNVPDGETASISIEFNLDLTQIVDLNGEIVPATATSNFNLSFEVDGNEGKTASFVSLLNADAANPFASADETDIEGAGDAGVSISFSDSGGVRHFVVTFTVGDGDHSFLINYSAAANATSVIPEPATLGLLGAGLLGLGAAARRRKIAA